MSCRKLADEFDRNGSARAASPELVAHVTECADCHRELSDRNVSRLALDVGGRLPALPRPLGAGELLAAAERERRRAPGLLGEVIPIAGRWLPRLAAAAALLVLVAGGAVLRDSRLGGGPDVVRSFLVDPEATLGADAVTAAVLSVEGS